MPSGPASTHRMVFVAETDRVPLGDVDDVVLDLDPPGATDDDVDLFLLRVLVAERDPEVRREREEAEAERLSAD